MKRKQLLSLLLAGASALALLTGCGDKATSSPSPEEPVTITVWTYYNGEQLESFSALVDEFNAITGKENGVTVECSSQGSVNDLETNVIVSAEGKVSAAPMPNIFFAYADTAYALDQMDQIADLSDYLTDDDRNEFIADYRHAAYLLCSAGSGSWVSLRDLIYYIMAARRCKYSFAAVKRQPGCAAALLPYIMKAPAPSDTISSPLYSTGHWRPVWSMVHSHVSNILEIGTIS